ncbi:MAG: cytochrome c family protein [Xanthomonadales bacterium]|nr:cytochrome c family protein [Xanthomonadales bacterium]
MNHQFSKTTGITRHLFTWFVALGFLTFAVTIAQAYERTTDCESCHGGFRDDPYNSLSDGSRWSNSLHNVHRNNMLNGDCETCHTSGSRSRVYLDSSDGGNGLSAIGCVGCHGRDGDMGNDSVSPGRGAGLRQHHSNAGITTCQACHSDANPGNYSPVGEDILPNYYANPGSGHAQIPKDSCNPSGTENFSGTSVGLDNDGDGQYDTADADCSVTATYMVGGTVTGLSGSGLVLRNNGGDDLAVNSNGSFTFATALEDGSAYNVTVRTQPSNPAQACNITNGSGTLSGGDVTNITVSCTNVTYTVGGTVSGLQGPGLVLQNNGGDDLAVDANGAFVFAGELGNGDSYLVTVKTRPTAPKQVCSINNRNGTVTGSDVINVQVACSTTLFQVNTGLNDAWYNPLTDGQGFFVTVFPAIQKVVLSWFTYDTQLPPQDAVANLGDPGHRWFNALGFFADNEAMLNIKIASGGIFDTTTDVTRVKDGTAILTFDDCNSGTLEYNIPSIGRSGIVPIQRINDANVALCESLAAQATVAETTNPKDGGSSQLMWSGNPTSAAEVPLLEMNPGLNDAWYYPVTDGQGFFITVFPDIQKVSLSWFTYDTSLPPEGAVANLGDPGHRWFNALGSYTGNSATMTIKITSGGIFDTTTEVSRIEDGTVLLTFTDCNSGTVEYNIPSIGQSGIVPIRRIVGDNIGWCESFITP